jgi:hypothetical protein
MRVRSAGPFRDTRRHDHARRRQGGTWGRVPTPQCALELRVRPRSDLRPLCRMRMAADVCHVGRVWLIPAGAVAQTCVGGRWLGAGWAVACRSLVGSGSWMLRSESTPLAARRSRKTDLVMYFLI